MSAQAKGVRSRALAWCLPVALILVPDAVLGQQTPSPIRGRIVADDNGRPLRRALVAPTGGDRRTRPVLTDDEGRFEIQPTDGSTSLTVTKAGYASAQLDLPRDSRASQREFEIRVPRGGVISGRIVDSNGEAAFGMKVVARQIGAAADRARIFDAEADDLGDYRIAGLPPGRYTVSPAVTGPRVLTVTQNDRLFAMIKEGRRALNVFQQSSSPPRSADVQSGDETGNIDFDVAATETFRAVIPVVHRLPQVQPLPNGQPGMATGPPLAELQGGRLLNVSTGGPPRSLDILVPGGGVVSGSVVDAAGEPFQGITMRALQVRREHGRQVARAVAWERVTDDRGRYRLFGLAPGSYLIVASLDATELTASRATAAGFAPLYFPGTTFVDAAQPLRVESGGDVSGTDLTFAAAPTSRLAGRAIGADGEPLHGRVFLGISQRSGAIAPDPRSERIEPDGSFELTDVAPGDYVLQASGEAGMGTPPEFASEFVTVAERDPPPITIRTSRGATLEGRFVVEGTTDPPMRAFSLRASPTDLDRSPPDGRGPQGLGIYDDGRFYLTGLFGRVRLSVPNPLPGWYLKSLTIGGVDVTDAPFDFGVVDAAIVADAQIVLSNSGATVAGSIVGQPAVRGMVSAVAVFSTSRDNWFDGSRHVKRDVSGPDGSFAIGGLPPGEYYVAAVDAIAPLDGQPPDTLESLVSRAIRVTAREGAVSTVTLIPVRR
jgi:hypothetical protein